MQVREQMHEVQDPNESRRQQMQLKERPVVRLAVADAGFAPRAFQAASFDFGRHLPTERFAAGHGRHHGAHALDGCRPPFLSGYASGVSLP